MDKKLFKKNILGYLEEWSYLGETITDLGTRLIGHRPDIAPEAYINIICPVLENSEILELASKFQMPVSEQYIEFLSHANGLNVFSGTLRVFGYIPPSKKTIFGLHDKPPTLMFTKEKKHSKEREKSEIVVAWYNDGSYVKLNYEGKAIRFNISEDIRLDEWEDFDTWLSSEIEILNKKYKTGKIEFFNPLLRRTQKSNEWNKKD